jgi:hypothetical protein
LKALRRIYRRLPAPAKRLAIAAKSSYLFAKETRCPAWILSGASRSGREPLAVGFCGSEESKHYLAKFIFNGDWRDQALGRAWLHGAYGKALAACDAVALFLWEIPKSQRLIFRPAAFAILPTWIRMDVSLAPGAEMWSTMKFRNTRNLFERHGLTREATKAAAAFDDFYSKIYHPYIKARHGSAAVAYSLEAARRDFMEDERELLLLKRGPEILGGAVLGYANDEARFWQMGTNLDIEPGLANIASDALYYAMFMHVAEKRLPALHMGYCRPFLSDGILEYKRRWGARLAGSSRPGERWGLRIVQETPALKSFLRNNPFIAMGSRNRQHLCGFVESFEDESSARAVAEWEERHCSPGGVDLRVYQLSPRIVLKKKTTARPKPAG